MTDPRHLDDLVARMLDGDEHSRRDFLRQLAGAGVTLSSAGLLAACGTAGTAQQSSSKTVASVNHPKTKIGNWTFSNWPLYIDKSVLKSFNAKYGGNVKYVEEINDNFEFFAKVRQPLQSHQAIGRDIVVLTDYMAARWVRDGYAQPLDKKNIPNAKNLVANLKTIAWDPKRDYSLPWQSGGTIIGYNRKETGGEKITSLKSLFDPKYKGRVTFLNEAYDSAGLVLLKNGIDPTKAKLPEILKAIAEINKAKQAGQIRRFTGNDYTTDLTKGNVAIAMAYSGDLVQLKADNPAIEYAFPDEGGMLFTDNMLEPTKAAHPYAAETMMNYVYEPAVAAKIAAYVNYITPVQGAQEILRKTDPKTANNPLIFPSKAIRDKLHAYPNLSPSDEQKMREAMSRVTGG